MGSIGSTAIIRMAIAEAGISHQEKRKESSGIARKAA